MKNKNKALYNATYYARKRGVEVDPRSRTLHLLCSDIPAYRDCRFFNSIISRFRFEVQMKMF